MMFEVGTRVTWTDGAHETRTGVVIAGIFAGRQAVRDDRTGLTRHPRNLRAA